MSRKQDQVMGHAADNDGIEEYDNPLPDWWIGLFIFTIIFAFGYTGYYHFWADTSQAKWYEEQMAAAAELYPTKDAAVSADAETIAAGEKVFMDNCMACHGANLEGGIGPMLTDKVWIHDGTPEGIIKTINEGVSAKGMPSWGPILGPEKISQVASFIVSKGGALEPGEAPAEAPAADASGQGEGDAPAADGGSEAAATVLEVSTDDITPELVAAGEEVFKVNCVACHKEDLTGLVGPSLVDDEWLHGGEYQDITNTVTNGVTGTAMIAWKPALGDEKVKQVAAFVYTKSHPE